MNHASEMSFPYKPKLGTLPAIIVAIMFFAVSIGIGAHGLSIKTSVSLYGLRINPTITKLLFLSFSALLAYVAIKAFLVTIRSADGGRAVRVSTDKITAPISPSSSQNVTIKFAEIASAQTVAEGNVTFLEISHKHGKLRIPNVMIESERKFAYLARLVQERSAKARQKPEPVRQEPSASPRDQQNAEKAQDAQLNPAAEALMRAIEEKRKTDPLIGAKLGGKEVFQRLLAGMKNERGVHVESLLCALGALAGYSCQASLRAQAVAKGMKETAALMTIDCANGKKYFFGDPLNKPLAESKYSVWSLAAAAAQHNGCTSLPDINGIFAHVTQTVGTDGFGVPRFPGHQAGDLPINYLKALWPALFSVVKMFCKEPREWPVLFGIAIQEALDAGKQTISPGEALQIIMESAIPMSKVDLATA